MISCEVCPLVRADYTPRVGISHTLERGYLGHGRKWESVAQSRRLLRRTEAAPTFRSLRLGECGSGLRPRNCSGRSVSGPKVRPCRSSGAVHRTASAELARRLKPAALIGGNEDQSEPWALAHGPVWKTQSNGWQPTKSLEMTTRPPKRDGWRYQIPPVDPR